MKIRLARKIMSDFNRTMGGALTRLADCRYNSHHVVEAIRVLIMLDTRPSRRNHGGGHRLIDVMTNGII